MKAEATPHGSTKVSAETSETTPRGTKSLRSFDIRPSDNGGYIVHLGYEFRRGSGDDVDYRSEDLTFGSLDDLHTALDERFTERSTR